MILKPYPPHIRSEIYLLSLSFELIKNRPILSNQAQKWKGDYLSDVKTKYKKFLIFHKLINYLRLKKI